MVPWAIALHGGAGNISPAMSEEKRMQYEEALTSILEIGVAKIEITAKKTDHLAFSALDVAELVVRALEDSPLFNAGKGSVLNSDWSIEMEACIMTSHRETTSTNTQAKHSVTCGAVCGLSTVVHPISLARLVMEKTPHIFLGFSGAEEFATIQGVERMPNDWFKTRARMKQLQMAKDDNKVQMDHSPPRKGPKNTSLPDKARESPQEFIPPAVETVGCVVVDSLGQCAAATSTGGLTNKMTGRIGDTPLVGAGNYANHICAVSATGVGEHIIKAMVGREIAAVMEYKGCNLSEASDFVVNRMEKGTCGVVAVSSTGELSMKFNTSGMFRAWCSEVGESGVAIW